MSYCKIERLNFLKIAWLVGVMYNFLKKERWSPYVAGGLIGLLSAISLLIFHKPIGTSTTFVKISALFWWVFNKLHLNSTGYYGNYLNNQTWIDWQIALVLGVFLGSFLSRLLTSKGSSFKNRESDNFFKFRFIQPIIGGIIVMFGARLAGGCTSGHAISGGVQLALSGWVFMIGVFMLGIPTALILYSKKGEKKI